METALYRLHYKGLPGNAVFYFVPGERGSIEVGERWVSWSRYLPVSEIDLPEFLVDRDGRRHDTSVHRQRCIQGGMNAVELASRGAEGGDGADLDDTLATWSAEQTRRGDRLDALGAQMEGTFGWDAPDFSTMSESQTRAWWTAAVTFPEEFNYVSDE